MEIGEYHIFRGKRVKELEIADPVFNNWVYGNLIMDTLDSTVYIEPYKHGLPLHINGTTVFQVPPIDAEGRLVRIPVQPDSVSQIIWNLRDIEGNFIFDKDIVTCTLDEDEEEDTRFHFTAPVIARNENNIIFDSVSLVTHMTLHDCAFPDNIVVVGNVIDNPDLVLDPIVSKSNFNKK